MNLIFIQPDQLHRNISALRDMDSGRDIVFMAECEAMFTNVPHHPQKITLILSAMRHFADALREEGFNVEYRWMDDPDNTGSPGTELTRVCGEMHPDRIVMTEPGDWHMQTLFEGMQREQEIPVEIRPDDRFLCSREDFRQWAEGRKQLRLEHFYRWMRRRSGMLMAGDMPIGGRWNFDADNRKALPSNTRIPRRLRFAPDAITREVMTLVRAKFGNNFGDLEPFGWATGRYDALRALSHFVETSLAYFGDYQDAMKSGEDLLFHSLISPYLNIGLLNPDEVCNGVLDAWDAGSVPINAVEGFIRQIIGWREFVRGIYGLKMPEYAETNALNAHRPLPAFFWSGDTEMNCLRECILATRRNAYAHHIQRLMVTGNFALLTGVSPAAVEAWYLAVYADAWDWVELPNTHGMVLYADGGIVGTKPYAASGAYIHRMSDYCRECAFNPNEKLGSKACPFNYLYWYFMMENAQALASNPRMAMPYRTLDRMAVQRREQIQQAAREFLSRI